MPIFEYSCNRCGQRFERLSFAAADNACPSCQGTELTRLPSAFAVGAAGRSPAPRPAAGGCGSCGDPRGPGACALD